MTLAQKQAGLGCNRPQYTQPGNQQTCNLRRVVACLIQPAYMQKVSAHISAEEPAASHTIDQGTFTAAGGMQRTQADAATASTMTLKQQHVARRAHLMRAPNTLGDTRMDILSSA